MLIANYARKILKPIAANLPAILTGLGAAGVFSTAVLAVRVTPEAHRRILDARSEQTEELTKLDMAKLTWRLYLPAAVVGTTTVAAIVAAQGINTKRQTAAIALYSLSEKALVEYKNKVIEEFGAKADEKVRDEVMKQYVMDTPMVNSEVIITGSGESLFMDSFSGRYFTSDLQSVREAVNNVNQDIIKFNYASQNDFYQSIGLPPVSAGDDVGWNTDQFLEVNYSTQLSDDGRPCVVVEYLSLPTPKYWKG